MPRPLVLLAVLTLAAPACGDDGSVLVGPTPAATAATPTSALPETTAPTVAPPATTDASPGTTAPPNDTGAPITTGSTTTITEPLPAPIPVISTVDASESNDDPPLVMSVAVPVVSGVPAAAADAMNTLVSGEVLGTAGSFRDSILAGGTAPDPSGVASELVLGYEAAAVSADILSLRFDLYTYYQGAAHGTSTVFTMSFDPQTGVLLSLDDILVPGTFGVLASIVEQHVIDDVWGGDAVEAASWTPVLDEFTLDGWVVTAGGLAFSFDQYEIGFGAMGAPTVVVPWPELAAVVDPPGPAGGYAFGP